MLVYKPLVNYAETINSYRSTVNSKWGSYQALLIGSAFVLTPISERNQLANLLWQRALTEEEFRRLLDLVEAILVNKFPQLGTD